MELNFIKSGDYYIPDIQLQNPNIHLGKWGLKRCIPIVRRLKLPPRAA